jgi:hypothetical protein
VSIQRERHPAPEVPSTGIASRQATESDADSTAELAASSDASRRANEVAAWLPTATREAVEAFAWRHYQRAESAAWCIAEQHRRDDLTAERMASIEISQALDWARQSTVPSFQELQRRRSVIT